jgi:hypothetical protein
MLPASLIWLALRLAPRGQELEHTSYFETDPAPHRATSGDADDAAILHEE